MATVQIQIRRAIASVLALVTPVQGELGIDLTTYSIIVGDGSTPGGKRQASEAYVQQQITAIANIDTSQINGATNNYLRNTCS